MENYFNKLNEINVSDKTEKKNGLTYLSWAWAWSEVKKVYPDANYIVYERYDEKYGNINYFTDGRTGWVKTGVIINEIEHIEYLPIMDYRNKSIPLENITSFEVNKTIQRSLTKALARHGLGLYIYAGEDLPEAPIEITEEYAKEYTITFGKHKDKKLVDLIETEDNYIEWILKSSKDETLLKCIEILTGRKPMTEEEQDEHLQLTVKLQDLIVSGKVDLEKMLEYYKVDNAQKLTCEQLKQIISKKGE